MTAKYSKDQFVVLGFPCNQVLQIFHLSHCSAKFSHFWQRVFPFT